MTATKSQGTVLWRISKKFQFAADKIIPDSFVFCLILTFIVFLCAIFITPSSPLSIAKFWFEGVWSQATFAFQMSFMVVTCAVTAKAPQVRRLLKAIASIPKSLAGAMILLMLFGYVSSFVNWAFCTIVTPILAMQLSKQVKGLHFPMMIAAGYSTMIMGQCLGPSASVYALLATAGHFMEDRIGVLTQDVTVYNSYNVILWIILAVFTMALAIFTVPPKDEVVEFKTSLDDEEVYQEEPIVTAADWMNGSKIFMWLTGFIGVVVIVESVISNGIMASLSINFVIFFFLVLNCFLYNTPRKFISAYKDSMPLATEVMVQFPFYGGIAGIMADSGLAAIVATAIASVASQASAPVWSYLSASFVNLFIPSQGGQWIVQGPVMVDMAEQVGGNVVHVINAFVYGDEATNLLQPLYVIPALSVVGMKLKDVWGFLAFIWVFWFVLTTVGLYVLPMLI